MGPSVKIVSLYPWCMSPQVVLRHRLHVHLAIVRDLDLTVVTGSLGNLSPGKIEKLDRRFLERVGGGRR